MKKIILGAAVVLATWQGSALAKEQTSMEMRYIPNASIQFVVPAYYVDPYASVDFARATIDGDGFQFAARHRFETGVSLGLETQSMVVGDAALPEDMTLQDTRLAVGVEQPGPLGLGVRLEYASMTLEDARMTGFGFHGFLNAELGDAVTLTASVGQISVSDDLDTFSGPETSVGMVLKANDNMDIVADYRKTMLANDDEVEINPSGLRVGVRFNF